MCGKICREKPERSHLKRLTERDIRKLQREIVKTPDSTSRSAQNGENLQAQDPQYSWKSKESDKKTSSEQNSQSQET